MIEEQKGFNHLIPAEKQADMLNDLLANISDQIYLFDREGRYLYINPKAEEVLRLKQRDVVGKTWSDLGLSPEDRESFEGQLGKVFATGESIRGEAEFPVGSQRCYEYLLNPVSRVKGTVETVVASVRDITERRQTEIALRESEERFKAFMKNSPAIAWMKDEQSRYVYLSEAYESRFGVRFEEWHNKTAFDIWPPEIARKFRENDRAVLTGGKTINVIEETINPDGERSYWWSFKFPFQDAAGRKYVGGIGVDITERKRLEEELAAAKEAAEMRVAETEEGRRILEAIMKYVPEGLAITDIQGIVTMCSKYGTELSGMTREEMVGSTVEERRRKMALYKPDGITPATDEDMPALKALKTGEPVKNWELLIKRRDGQEIPILSNVGPIKDKSGSILGIVHAWRDISEVKQAQEKLRQSEEQYRIFFDDSPIPMWVYCKNSLSFLAVNHAAVAEYGYSKDEFLKMTIKDIRPPEDIPRLMRSVGNFQGIQRRAGVWRHRKKTGTVIDVDIATHDTTYNGKEARIVIATDITERKQMEETIRYQAHYDTLTDLPNRTLLTDHLTSALAQAHRYQKKLAVMFLDLDRFKTINDTLGHTTGDELLKEVARRIKPCIRETDTIARLGGDEFTVLLSQISHLEDASRVAEKIMAIFKEPFTISGHTFCMTATIGISVYPEDGSDNEALLKNADIAMYHAKEQGRNSYQFYSPSLNIRTLERMILENSLRQTLQRGELELFYQPQFDIATGRIVCTEALIRWRHPELGLLDPMQFIPIAEEIGFIVSIDEWVLRTACVQNKAWQDAGYLPVCVTVNLSARQFRHPHLVDTVFQILKESGLEPQWLELEVTESIAMEDIEHTIPSVRKLVELGVNFSIDDFGTGYSSLSHLKKLPIRKLKIDKSFISDIATDPDDRAIVNAIISLAHNMNMKVLAEGVETTEQLWLLQASWCDEIQGFLGSRPLSVEEYKHFVRSNGYLRP